MKVSINRVYKHSWSLFYFLLFAVHRILYFKVFFLCEEDIRTPEPCPGACRKRRLTPYRKPWPGEPPSKNLLSPCVVHHQVSALHGGSWRMLSSFLPQHFCVLLFFFTFLAADAPQPPKLGRWFRVMVIITILCAKEASRRQATIPQHCREFDPPVDE